MILVMRRYFLFSIRVPQQDYSLSIMVAMGKGATAGILFKNASALEDDSKVCGAPPCRKYDDTSQGYQDTGKRYQTLYTVGLGVGGRVGAVVDHRLGVDQIVAAHASHATRRAMDQLVADNIISWFAGKGPLTPVPETPVKK